MINEALKLADELDSLHQYVPSESPAMIRRLVGELDKAEERNLKIVRKNEKLLREFFRVKEELACALDYIKQYQLETKPTITKVDGKVIAVTMTNDEHRVHEVLWEAPKPLSDDEIKEVCKEVDVCFDGVDTYRFARAIEERHGIK